MFTEFRRLALTSAVAVTLLAVLPSGSASAIINGDPATKPSTVSLQSVKDGVADHECGGALIAPDWVLTAAHCAPYVQDQARLGSVTWNAGGVVVRVARDADNKPAVYKNPAHDSVNGGFGNDAALVRLERPVWGAPLLPIGIPGRSGAVGNVAGWGRTCDRDFDDPACNDSNPVRLWQLPMKRVADETCNLIRPRDGVQLMDPATMNCVVVADGRQGGVCFGDSGSPYTEKVRTRFGEVTVVTGIVNGIMNGTFLQPDICSRKPPNEINRDAVTDVGSQLEWLFDVLLTHGPEAAQGVRDRLVTTTG
ncbi:S1 family peptidase [Streptodolium elevatio]